jgi:pimeloyl-ACP methyl ester carboxylesterase
MQRLEQDGLALFYEETGEGEPPILLVHGWCCDHTYFAPQFEHFARRGRHVVAVDLRGHGKSDKPHQSYTVQLFADDLAWMCAQIGLEKPVVIGHSMGGVIVLALALRYLPSSADSLVWESLWVGWWGSRSWEWPPFGRRYCRAGAACCSSPSFQFCSCCSPCFPQE